MGASFAIERVADERRDGLRPVVLLGLLVAVGNLYRFRSDFHAMDDAWISFRVARNWVEHGVLSFDVGRAPVEGMTNLLWTLMSASWIALWPEGDPVVPARIGGALLHLATLGLLARLAVREAASAGGRPVLAAAVTLGLSALSSSLAYYALSGLETALWGFLFVAALDRYRLALAGSRRAGVAAGVLLGLLAMTRPEGVLVAGALWAGAVAVPTARRAAVAIVAPCALLVAGMELFRLVYFGDLLPNTFYAKPPAGSDGFRYLARFGLFALGAVGPLALLGLRGRTTPLVRVTGVLLVLLAAGAVWSGGDWMPGHRRLTTVVLGMNLLIGLGVACARPRHRGLVVAAAVAAAVANVAAARQIDWNAYNTRMMGALGRLAAETETVDEVALVDIGRFGWSFDGEIYDLAGLTDRHLARLPGRYGFKGWDEAYFRDRSPELVLLMAPALGNRPLQVPAMRSWERGALASMARGGGYAYHGAVAYMDGADVLIFRRTDVELPESIWGEPSSRDLLGEVAAGAPQRAGP